MAQVNNPTRTCMTARRSGIHLFDNKHSWSPCSTTKDASYVDILKFPNRYKPYTGNPKTATPKMALATPTVMNVKNTSRANTSLDPRSFSFGRFAETTAVATRHSGVSVVIREGIRVEGEWNPGRTRGYRSPWGRPVVW
jgi:hypothetical protein